MTKWTNEIIRAIKSVEDTKNVRIKIVEDKNCDLLIINGDVTLGDEGYGKTIKNIDTLFYIYNDGSCGNKKILCDNIEDFYKLINENKVNGYLGDYLNTNERLMCL